jgi:hypothetical protein
LLLAFGWRSGSPFLLLVFGWRSGSPFLVVFGWRSGLPFLVVFGWRSGLPFLLLVFGWRSGSPFLFLFLGGAAVYRCDKGPIFSAGFSRRGSDAARSQVFQQLLITDAVTDN